MERVPSSPDTIESAILELGRADLGRVFRLAYVSRASVCFQPTDLEDIEAKSGPKNEAADITGILVMDAGNILQILEGEREKVLSLFETIARDPRHEEVRQVAGSEQTGRLLNCWSMVSGGGKGAPAGIMGDFHKLHARYSKVEELVEVTPDEVELLKVIALLRSVPL